MNKKKLSCKCPSKLRKICKHTKLTDCKDVAEIIEALTYEEECSKKSKRPYQPRLKLKKVKLNSNKSPPVPMAPPMYKRLKYIGHCSLEPLKRDDKIKQTYGALEFQSSSDEDGAKSGILKKRRKSDKFKKKVRYYDLLPGDVMLPTPVPVVQHTASDQSILNVPSPKISGEVIQAQRASVKPTEVKPPLPSKSGHDLFKPHSGIVINRNKEFVPNIVHIPGPKIIQSDGNWERKPCYKGGVCRRKICKGKKQLKQAVKRRRKLARQMKKYGSETIYKTRVAADGKPRALKSQKHLKDDDSLCGLDEIPKPEHAQIPSNLKRGMFQTHSLTVLPCTKEEKPEIPYGILIGSYNMYDNKFGGRSRGRQAVTMSVMAYCLAFHYHPKQWTTKLLDNLIDAGDQWYIQCLENVHDHTDIQGICEVLPFDKKQTLILNGKRMKVLLEEPDIVGYTMSLDPTVYNLCRGLKAFFKANRAGVLLTRVLKVVIWKDKVCYYVFDPAGRDARAYSNFSSGAALINIKDLESVARILLGRTILDDQKFVLSPVKVLRMINEKCDEDFESDKELTQAEKAMMSYRILNGNCAIVNGNINLGDRCFEDAKFRQALPIAVVAMTYAKISPPNTWFTKTLDKLLRLGNKLFLDCLHPKVMIDLTIDNIPNEITIGPYACEIIIYRERVKGQLFTTKECLFNIKTGLEEFFSHEYYNSGILEFNNYWLAVWRQKEMLYLFDPYPRTNDGSRSVNAGRACCWMLLNTETMSAVFTKNWDYLPTTTQFYIHAFKVLKLKKREPKKQIVCTLSDDQLPGKKLKRKVISTSRAKGDGKEVYHDILPMDTFEEKPRPQPDVDEEKMGEIISLVDSIQEEYVPSIPLRYKNLTEPRKSKDACVDSPTVSVTQVVALWPKYRDKSNELPEPDPDPEPTPPPTPPPPPIPEGGIEEEEQVEEEEDEETIKRKKEEEERRKAEEEEARRKAEELPPAFPPPPPTPQSESEVQLAPPTEAVHEEVESMQPVQVDRHILLNEDAKYRSKLRQIRKKMTLPLSESPLDACTPSKELLKPSNFKQLPDNTGIIRGSSGCSCCSGGDAMGVLPFTAIMAIVTSYKYSINTWSSSIISFIVDTAKKLYHNKKEKFQLAPVHIIPKIGIGHQAYHAHIDVFGEGPTWQLEDILAKEFLPKYDRGMITTTSYSCAFFKRNGLYYLFDGCSCNAMGLRDACDKGKPCFLRFTSLHALVSRIIYNKDGQKEDQQFILSRILVRRLLTEPRMKLPEDHDYATGLPQSKKSRQSIVPKEKTPKKSSIDITEVKSESVVGYQLIDGLYRIEGTTALKDRNSSSDVKNCHFVSLIAMLMATMHPIRTWNHFMMDTCIEKGLEIYEKATNLSVCERRVIKNLLLDGKFINVNIKKILVVNENPEKRLEQYLKAVLGRLRYVLIKFPHCSMVVCQTDGYYHIFDPYPPPAEDLSKDLVPANVKNKPEISKKGNAVATWTLYRSMDSLIRRIRKVVSGNAADAPEFYTFELTSVKKAPRHAALNYRLSPLFKPDENPNTPYLKRRKVRPLVDEKMYWLNIESLPWSRMNPVNDLGFERKTPKTLWREWDIEFPGDLYSLWGTIHPLDAMFDENHRGKQYLATCVVALAMTQACKIEGWTTGFLDGIVITGDKYHKTCIGKIGIMKNHEISIEDMECKFDDMYPYSFTVKFDKIIFGFVYNILPDRFNLSKALCYFFEKNTFGILTSPSKNLAFGKMGLSYFMFDCQSHGAPVFCPGQGAAYVLKCESLNRLIYCMTQTLNVRRHGQQFHLYSVAITLSEKTK